MKNPAIAMIGLLALAACGEETSAQNDRTQQSVEAPTEQTDAASKVEEVAEATAAPAAEPEPVVDAVIAFKSEDGELALPREALMMVSPVHDGDGDTWSVFVQMEEAAAERFYTLTTKIAGEAMSIIVDDMVVSTPILDQPVYGGGFVFQVDNDKVASTVVAALKGQEEALPLGVAVAAEEALPSDENDAEEVASADEADDLDE